MRRMATDTITALPARSAPRALHVLLLEDDETARLATATLLQQLGCRVDTVRDGSAAVDAVVTTAYDVVLMDILFPKVNGLEAFRAIRGSASGDKFVPIVAMTKNMSAADRNACASAGVAAFLAKPTTREKLAAALAQTVALPDICSTDRDSAPSDALDRRQVKSIRASLGNEAEAIIALFLKETADRLARMERLSGADQRRTLNREAHSLKSAAATFGCSALAKLSLALEEEAATLDVALLPARITELLQAYTAAKAELLNKPN